MRENDCLGFWFQLIVEVSQAYAAHLILRKREEFEKRNFWWLTFLSNRRLHDSGRVFTDRIPPWHGVTLFYAALCFKIKKVGRISNERFRAGFGVTWSVFSQLCAAACYQLLCGYVRVRKGRLGGSTLPKTSAVKPVYGLTATSPRQCYNGLLSLQHCYYPV